MTHAEYRRSLKGRPCYVGLDLSSTKDLTALVGVFPDADGFDVLPEFFVPAESIRERSVRDRVPYDEWARRGELHTTPGNSVDYEYVRDTINGWAGDFDIQVIGCDPWNARDLLTRLAEQDGFVCVEVRQGFASLSAPSKSLERAILSRRLRHNGHAILRWCVGNVALEDDPAGNIKPSKSKSTERIDGVVALVIAIDQMDRHYHAAGAPQYSVQVVG
jgi:phage terminase large subunit-like protein